MNTFLPKWLYLRPVCDKKNKFKATSPGDANISYAVGKRYPCNGGCDYTTYYNA